MMPGGGSEAPSSASRGGTSTTTGTRATAKQVSDEAKAELRRFKNREAARRVRERKTTALNTFKGQVDELKRENQKLLQIIAQLRGASLSAPCLSAGGGGSAVIEALATAAPEASPRRRCLAPAARCSCSRSSPTRSTGSSSRTGRWPSSTTQTQWSSSWWRP